MSVMFKNLEVCHNNVNMAILNTLNEKISSGEVSGIVFGPKNNLEEENIGSIFFRVIYEDAKVKAIGKKYKVCQGIRITSNVDDLDVEYAKQESIRLNSWLADRIFKDKEFKKLDFVNDVSLTNVLTAYPLEKEKPNQFTSGIRILVEYNLDFQCTNVH